MRTFLAAILLVGVVPAAQAIPVTSIPGGTIYPFPPPAQNTAGPRTIAPGITWTSTVTNSAFAFTGAYGFCENGDWNGLNMIGLIGDLGTMTIAFDSPVAAVGGFINYAPCSFGEPSISVYDSTNALLETLPLTFLTGGAANSGAFRGFSEAVANISFFRLNNAAIGLTDLTVNADAAAPSAVPEPSTIALFGFGLLGLGAMLRRRKQRVNNWL